MLKSGTSAGANYEEAGDGSSPRDSLAKTKIVLRGSKETRAQEPVLEETGELVKIVATIVKNKQAGLDL